MALSNIDVSRSEWVKLTQLKFTDNVAENNVELAKLPAAVIENLRGFFDNFNPYNSEKPLALVSYYHDQREALNEENAKKAGKEYEKVPFVYSGDERLTGDFFVVHLEGLPKEVPLLFNKVVGIMYGDVYNTHHLRLRSKINTSGFDICPSEFEKFDKELKNKFNQNVSKGYVPYGRFVTWTSRFKDNRLELSNKSQQQWLEGWANNILDEGPFKNVETNLVATYCI